MTNVVVLDEKTTKHLFSKCKLSISLFFFVLFFFIGYTNLLVLKLHTNIESTMKNKNI